MSVEKIKKVYENLVKDKKLNHIYDRVEQKINYVIAHGNKHVENVTKYINMVCEELCVDERVKYLALIAGTLHDVGRLESREYHTVSGAGFARAYLLGKLDDEECDLVCDAIIKHEFNTFDYESKNDVAWVLLFADKLDYTRDRYLLDLLEEEHKSKFSYNIKSITLNVEDGKAEINLVLFKKQKDFDKNSSYVSDIYKKVLQHFGIKKIKFVKTYEK